MRRSCPYCGHHWAWHLNDHRYRCRFCRKSYTWQTVWHSFRIDERAKCKLLEYFVFGVPAYRLRFRAPVALRTIERFFLTIRKTLWMVQYADQDPREGAFECDESSFGGYRPGKRGWGAAGKIIVFGILKRNGEVRATPIPSRQKDAVLSLIAQYSSPGSLYYTDEWQAYASLAVRGRHVVVRKERGIPKGRDHINGIEGFWSYAKHWLYQYRGVSKKFFPFYLAELCYRFNHRNEDLYPLILKALQTIHKEDLP
jgi:transposase